MKIRISARGNDERRVPGKVSPWLVDVPDVPPTGPQK
jgi:hypothetical protein